LRQSFEAITSVHASGSTEGGSRPKPAQRVERSESLEAPEASLTIPEVMASSRVVIGT
jgi:hypothetical protein